MKKIILNEAQEKAMITMMVKPQQQYSIHPEKVLLVKKFLDNGFQRGSHEDLGPNGMPQITRLFGMLDSMHQNVLKTLNDEDMLDCLKDQFPNICPTDDEKNKFLGKVMDDWYNNKIGLYGSLSVNHL